MRAPDNRTGTGNRHMTDQQDAPTFGATHAAQLATENAELKRQLRELAAPQIAAPANAPPETELVRRSVAAPGPGILSRALALVTPGKRLSLSEADLAQMSGAARAGMRVASRRPGGPMALMLLLVPPLAYAWARWSADDALLTVLADPILRIGYAAVLPILATGAAIAIAQWARLDRDGVELARREGGA